MHVATEMSLAMSSQNWCNLLAIDLGTIQEKRAAKCRKKIMAMLTPKSELFPEVKT